MAGLFLRGMQLIAWPQLKFVRKQQDRSSSSGLKDTAIWSFSEFTTVAVCPDIHKPAPNEP